MKTFTLQTMYTCEHWASNLVQDAIFKSFEIHVTLSVNLIQQQQQQHVSNKNTLIAYHLFSSFSTTFKNAVFICCC